MKKLLIAALLCSPMVVSAEGLYGGIDYSMVSLEGGGDKVKPKALRLRLGNQVSPNLAVEGHLGFGMSDDSYYDSFFDENVTVEVDNIFGVYLKGLLPVSPNFSAFALLGYTKGEATFSAPGVGSGSEDESDLSLGLGASLKIGEKSHLNADYIQAIDKDGFEVNTLSFGVRVDF